MDHRASTGIGRQVALQLAARGVVVAASACSGEKLASLGPNIRPYPLDVTDQTAVLAKISRIERDLWAIDLAVLVAGTYTLVYVENFAPTIFVSAMRQTTWAWRMPSGLLPAMLARRAGHVAWIASVAGYVGLPKAAAYCPSRRPSSTEQKASNPTSTCAASL